MRRGIRFPQWWMLLVAILAILSNQGSLMGMERFAKRHRKTLNELLGTQVAKPPSDSTFRLLLAQLDVEGFEGLLQQWMATQPGVTETVDTLVCDGKTLRGSIDETASGAALFIAQVSLYSNSLGVAIAQSTYATDAGGEIAALRQLLDRVELAGWPRGTSPRGSHRSVRDTLASYGSCYPNTAATSDANGSTC